MLNRVDQELKKFIIIPFENIRKNVKSEMNDGEILTVAGDDLVSLRRLLVFLDKRYNENNLILWAREIVQYPNVDAFLDDLPQSTLIKIENTLITKEVFRI